MISDWYLHECMRRYYKNYSFISQWLKRAREREVEISERTQRIVREREREHRMSAPDYAQSRNEAGKGKGQLRIRIFYIYVTSMSLELIEGFK